jgi:two-component system chemotaxis response regulator CheY
MIKVLIADDTAFMRMMLKTMLINNGFDVVGEAVDGNDAVLKYKNLKPDIITMDITMPNLTGIEALMEIIQYDSKAKVVMISAMGQEAMVKQAVMNGASSFVVKPFKEEQVIKVLNQLS